MSLGPGIHRCDRLAQGGTLSPPGVPEAATECTVRECLPNTHSSNLVRFQPLNRPVHQSSLPHIRVCVPCVLGQFLLRGLEVCRRLRSQCGQLRELSAGLVFLCCSATLRARGECSSRLLIQPSAQGLCIISCYFCL